MKKIRIIIVLILLFSFLQVIWAPTFEVAADSSLSNLTIVSPQNRIYTSQFLTLNVTFNYFLASVDSVSYSIDGSGRYSFSRRYNSEDSTIIHGTIIEVSALPELAEGPHTITVYLEGALYFQGDDYIIRHYSERATVHFTINRTYVDTKPPNISGLSVENKTYNQLGLPLDFTIDEPTSWVGYSLDDAANVTLTGSTILTLKEGFHSITLYAKDTAGNMVASETIYFVIDATSPSISRLTIENKTYNQLDLPLDFTVSEPASWIGYSLDNEANVTLAGNTILTLKEGSHSIVLYANDTAGNMGKSDMVHFNIQPCPDATLLSAASAVSIVIIATILIGYLKNKKKRRD